MKPWQHIVQFPDREVVIGEEFFAAWPALTAFVWAQAHGLRWRDIVAQGWRATLNGTAFSVIVTEDHDPGDEDP